MRALVTGAAGFLGRHVVRRLQEDGLDTTGFDRNPAPGLEGQLVLGDLLNQEGLTRAARGHQVICHIGAIGDVYLATEQPALAAAVNVTGSANVAEAARQVGARVVYASTWEVYGRPRYEPIEEGHPREPDHPYNITKLAGESLLLAADRLQDVPVLALRLGTAYGTGLRPNSVFRIFIDRAQRGQPILIQGDGSQARQFTHTADIARAFSLASRSELRGMALNVVAPDPISIKQLAELVVERFPTDVVFGPARAGDVPPALVSSERIGGLLGWRAEVPFERGLSELMEAVELEG